MMPKIRVFQMPPVLPPKTSYLLAFSGVVSNAVKNSFNEPSIEKLSSFGSSENSRSVIPVGEANMMTLDQSRTPLHENATDSGSSLGNLGEEREPNEENARTKLWCTNSSPVKVTL